MRRPVGIDHAGGFQQAKKCSIVDHFHDHMDIGENLRAGLSFPCPKQTLLNHLILAADSNIDAQNRPGSEGTLKLGGCGHGWSILGENIGHAASGAGCALCLKHKEEVKNDTSRRA